MMNGGADAQGDEGEEMMMDGDDVDQNREGYYEEMV